MPADIDMALSIKFFLSLKYVFLATGYWPFGVHLLIITFHNLLTIPSLPFFLGKKAKTQSGMEEEKKEETKEGG